MNKKITDVVLCFVLLLSIVMGSVFFKSDVQASGTIAGVNEQEMQPIVWDFENQPTDGPRTTSPFYLKSGALKWPISNWTKDRNLPNGPNGLQGDYFLSTLQVDDTTAYDESQIAELYSPKFVATGDIKLLVAGGGAGGTYIALCDKDGLEVEIVEGPNGHVFVEKTITIPKILEGKEMFLKIVDSKTANYAFICVDYIRFTGIVTEIIWNFENQSSSTACSVEPFTLTSGEAAWPISNWPYERNGFVSQGLKVTNNLQGNYFLTSLQTGPGWNEFLEKQVPVFTSPTFKPFSNVSVKVAGGNDVNNLYVALCDKNGDVISKVTGSNGHVFQDEILVVPADKMGQEMFIKIVDNKTAGWGFICVDDIRFSIYEEEPLPENIVFDFEDGTTAPFEIVSGSVGRAVGYRDTEFNATLRPINKQGTYYLTTEEDQNGMYKDEQLVVMQSSLFTIDTSKNPLITFKLGGGVAGENYLALCKEDGTEIIRAMSPANQYIFADMGWDASKLGITKEDKVYLKLVDNNAGGWGFVILDDFRVTYGKAVSAAKDIMFDFESGTMAPFTLISGFLGRPVGYRDTDYNVGMPINKQGKYYLTTEENANGSYNDGQLAVLRSPMFKLDVINSPVVSFKIGGGTNADLNYVALCREDGSVIVKAASPVNQYAFTDMTWNLAGRVSPDEYVYLEVVDKNTGGWGHVIFDDFKAKGWMEVQDIEFDFESGMLAPFYYISGGIEKVISNRATDYNSTRSINKNGNYYLTTLERTNGQPDDTQTGVMRSPMFTIDVENSPIVTFKIGGGSNPNAYVALCKENGDIIYKASGVNDYVFTDRSWNLTGKITDSDYVYLEVVDNATGAWSHVIFDNFKARGTISYSSRINSEQELANYTGWNTVKFNALKELVQDLIDTYGDEYANGTSYLAQIQEKHEEHDNMWKQGSYKSDDPAITAFKEAMDALQIKAIKGNPLLSEYPLLITARNQYIQDHHNTHTMFPSADGEVNSGYYTPGGALRVFDVGTGNVTTIAETSTGVFRDPDVAYDGSKFLISYRKDAKDSYHIYEYTLNESKTAITNKKQLTAMLNADDMDPMYMPSGNIVFSATRDPKYVMCNQHISSNIYRMEADGANIVKITNSTLFERPTDLLPDGRILYDRWEYNDRDFGSAQGLWLVAEDGTQQVTYYGNNSPTGASIDARSIPGTQKVMAILSSTHDLPWGALAIIDRSKGVDGSAPIVQTWPADVKNAIRNTGTGNNIDAFVGLYPKYEDPNPLSDKFFLVSRQIPGKGSKMGIYYVDLYGNEMLLYEDSTNFGAFDVQVIKSKQKENIAASRRNYLDQPGSFFVQDVYKGTTMANVAKGSVKTLRIVESCPKNFHTPYQWGGEGQQNPGVNWHSFEVKRTIGEVPVYEDGSAYFEVPQDKFVYFQLLDAEGRMVQSMRSGTLVQSGEKTGCIGCHEDRRTAPSMDTKQKTPIALEQSFKVIPNPDFVEGTDMPKTIGINVPDKPMKRTIDFAGKSDELKPYNEVETPTMNFLTEVQPIFTNNCISCHGYENPKANLTLVPDKGLIFNASYVDLWRNRGKGGVRFGNLLGAIGAGDNSLTQAKTWGSFASPLINKIYNDPAHKDLLTEAEKRRVAEWVDLNATYYGDYASNYPWTQGGRAPLSDGDLNALWSYTGRSWGFSWGESRPMPVYFDNPEKSPILAGITGANRTNALNLIIKGQNQLKAEPDVDWRGLTSMPGNPSVKLDKMYTFRATDQWRYDKVQLRNAIEAANRRAIAEGKKRYDSALDPNPANKLLEWPTTPYPGR